MSCSLLTLFSLLGLGLGMTTAFAQRLQRQKTSVSTRRTTAPRPFTLSVERTFSQHQQTVRTLTWSPDEAMVASGGNDDLAFVWKRDGDDQQLILWSMQTLTPVQRQSQSDACAALAWSPSGQFLVRALGSRVVLWHRDV